MEEHNTEEVNIVSKKKRKLHTYEKAKLAYERIVKEKNEKKQLAEQKKKQREEAIKQSNEMKKRKMKCMYKRTKRGQPKLGYQVDYLLEKIKRQKTK